MNSLLKNIKPIYLFIRFSAIGFSVFLPVLGLLSVNQNASVDLVLALCSVAILFHVFAYVLNDVIDLPIDKTEPFRADYPLVKGDVNAQTALIISLCVIPAVFVLTWFITDGAQAYLPLGLAISMMAIYNLFGKKINFPFLMDVIQGVGWASLVWFGAVILGEGLTIVTWILISMTIIYTLMINGVHGALRDLENDTHRGAKTTAIKMGVVMNESVEIKLPPVYVFYAFFLQLSFSTLSMAPLFIQFFEFDTSSWWASFSILTTTNLLAIFLLIKAIKMAHSKWDFYYYGMFHLILTLGTFLLIFLFFIQWAVILILLIFYILPIALMILFGGVHWENWQPDNKSLEPE